MIACSYYRFKSILHLGFSDALNVDFTFSQTEPDQAITFNTLNDITGTISSPSYPANFSTSVTSMIRIISVPKLALLQLYFIDRQEDDLPMLYMAKSTMHNETLITRSHTHLVMPDCKVILHLPPQENQKSFKIRYTGEHSHVQSLRLHSNQMSCPWLCKQDLIICGTIRLRCSTQLPYVPDSFLPIGLSFHHIKLHAVQC